MTLKYDLAVIAMSIMVPTLFFWGWAFCIRKGKITLAEIFVFVAFCAAMFGVGSYIYTYNSGIFYIRSR